MPQPYGEQHVTRLSQRLLLKLYTEAFLGSSVATLLAQYGAQQRNADSRSLEETLWCALAARLLGPRSRLTPRQQSALVSLMTGTLHVGETLFKWGLRHQVELCP
jgi:hypothetical protein